MSTDLDLQTKERKAEEASRFAPGCRLEARDFDGNWYPARVEDVDWSGREVLVHFEKWSCKFDEWVPMDSNRLRSVQPPEPKKPKVFSRGDQVLAMWSAYQKYPASVQRVLPDGKYEVLFEDGFIKRLPSNRVWKRDASDRAGRSFEDVSGIGSKQDRRDRKRKYSVNVVELLKSHKRPATKRSSGGQSEGLSPVQRGKSPDVKTLAAPVATPQPSPSTSESHLCELRPPEEIEVHFLDGRTEKWTKMLTRRTEGKTAGRLDIVITSSLGRKFRSRTEILRYCDEHKIRYDPQTFDFSARSRPKLPSQASAATTEHKTEVAPLELPANLPLETSAQPPAAVSGTSPLLQPAAGSTAPPAQQLGVTSVATALQQPAALLTPAPALLSTDEATEEESKKFIGNLEIIVEDGQFICPIGNCRKHFRKENLLHMHMKHYHPDLSKYLDYTPSVTDLAYARTASSGMVAETGSPSPRATPRRSLDPKRSPYRTKDCRVELNKLTKLDDIEGLIQQGSSSTSNSKKEVPVQEEIENVAGTVAPIVEEPEPPSPVNQRRPYQPKCPPPEIKEEPRMEEGGDLVQRNPILNTLLSTRPAAVPPSVRWRPYWRRGRRYSRHRRHMPPRPPIQPVAVKEEEGVAPATATEPSPTTSQDAKVEKLRRYEIINCTCQLKEEDGLMIQCDVCLCWQHGHCLGIPRQSNVPDTYICKVCREPYKGRSSRRYRNHQAWIKQGVLPSLSYRKKNEETIARRQALLKRSFELSGQLSMLMRLLHSLRTKVNIAKHKDHPKLWLWAHKESDNTSNLKTEDPATPKIPEPEKPIDPVECKINLLGNIERYQSVVEARITSIENQLAELEALEDDLGDDDEGESCPRTKETVVMLLRDLDTLNKVSKLP